MHNDRLHKLNRIATWLIAGMAVANVGWLFCFSSLIMGDGLDLYGRVPWWDKLLHAESGFLLSMIALWLIHVIMPFLGHVLARSWRLLGDYGIQLRQPYGH